MPKQFFCISIEGNPLTIQPMLLPETILSISDYKGWGAGFKGGNLYIQEVSGGFYDFYLVTSALDSSTRFTVDNRNGKGLCLCYSIKEAVNIRFNAKTGIKIPPGRFNMLPITNSEIVLGEGVNAHVFIKLPDYTFPDMEFNFPYITGYDMDNDKEQKEVLLRWQADSYENEEIYQLMLQALQTQYPAKKGKTIFANFMSEIMRSSIYHWVGASTFYEPN